MTVVTLRPFTGPAMDAIGRVFSLVEAAHPTAASAAAPALSYELLYGPDVKYYMFNAHVVTAPRLSSPPESRGMPSSGTRKATDGRWFNNK